MAEIDTTIETKENKKNKARPGFNLDEKVPVYIPRSAGDQYVAVGKGYMLPEGKTSYVPRFVEQELKRAEHAKDLLAAEMEKRQYTEPNGK